MSVMEIKVGPVRTWQARLLCEDWRETTWYENSPIRVDSLQA